MSIRPYSRYKADTISRVNSANYVNNVSKDTVVTRVERVASVTHGFNPATLYLVKLAKILKEEKKMKDKKKKIKYMTLEEMKEYLHFLQEESDEDNEVDLLEMNDQQILYIQDILTTIEDSTYKINGIEPIIIDQDITSMNTEEVRKFLTKNKKLFSESGLFHYDLLNVENLSDAEILEIKVMIISKINDIHDLFYYNKAALEYEKSYDNMSYINSEGVNVWLKNYLNFRFSLVK